MIRWLHSDKNIWSLLKRNISKGQMIGYVLSNIIGLSVVLIGVLFYLDSNNSSEENDKYFSSDFIVLSKKVDGIGFNQASFEEEEVAQLEKQPWVKKIGRFMPSQYAVYGAVEMGGRGLSSYLFFESIPDEFFDIKPRDWKFDPEEKFVPVILCKDYLTLYNFGFAAPQGLPQISEDIIGAIPLKLRLSGNGRINEAFDAAIVGFSSRLNTIAVPQSFMDWANDRFAPGTKPTTSRLIVEIDRLSSDDAYKYLEDNDIEIAGDKANDGNVSKFLSTSSLVITINGLLISSLAVFILVLSIFLLLQKSKEKLRYLMLLGYSPKEISTYYERIVVFANIIVSAIALVISLLFRNAWTSQLTDIGLGQASTMPVVIILISYLLIVSTLNILIIRKFMLKIWNNE